MTAAEETTYRARCAALHRLSYTEKLHSLLQAMSSVNFQLANLNMQVRIRAP